MSSKTPAAQLIQVPELFSIVEQGVFRCASPTAAQIPYLQSLGLKTIISLTPEHPIKPLLAYAKANEVNFLHIGTKLWRPIEDWKPIRDEIVKTALELMLDSRRHPLLLIDPLGIHHTGIVVGCLRKMQDWNFASTLVEYRSHSGQTKHRYIDEQYIEMFDPDLINLPAKQHLPVWWYQEDEPEQETLAPAAPSSSSAQAPGMQELESDHYDVIVLGTGVSESVAAAALAKAGKTVLHLDENDYYGGDQASLTVPELIEWCAKRSTKSPATTYLKAQASRFTQARASSEIPNGRRYALSLFPAILPSRGPLIDTLIASDVSKYVSFRLLGSVSIWDSSTNRPVRVPGSKEAVFKEKRFGLLEKRRLMKFLLFAAGDFESDELLAGKEHTPFVEFLQNSFQLSKTMAESIMYAIAHSSGPEDPTLAAMQRTRRYLKSLGRYGSSSFLVGQYGGAGEVSQGFCRACAVHGGTYILGEQAQPSTVVLATSEELALSAKAVSITLPSHPRPVTADHLVANPDYLEATSVSEDGIGWTAHAICILPSLPQIMKPETQSDVDLDEEEQDKSEDAIIVVFPPEGNQPLVRILLMGEGTGSCPEGQYVAYLQSSMEAGSDPENLLRPYLDRLAPIDSESAPIFTAFYGQRQETAHPSFKERSVVVEPYSGSEPMTEGLDWDAEQGAKAFWRIMGEPDGVLQEGAWRGFFESSVAEEQAEEE